MTELDGISMDMLVQAAMDENQIGKWHNCGVSKTIVLIFVKDPFDILS